MKIINNNNCKINESNPPFYRQTSSMCIVFLFITRHVQERERDDQTRQTVFVEMKTLNRWIDRIKRKTTYFLLIKLTNKIEKNNFIYRSRYENLFFWKKSIFLKLNQSILIEKSLINKNRFYLNKYFERFSFQLN